MIFKKSGPPEWLLVCLGNYGKEYENTRHNIGFMAAERLIDKHDLRCNRLRFRALTEVIEFGGANVLLMMPQTYMNLSGEAVGEAARFYKIPADHVIVISDDISLPLGKVRGRAQRSQEHHRPPRHRQVPAREGRRRRTGARHRRLGHRPVLRPRTQGHRRRARPRARGCRVHHHRRRARRAESLQRLSAFAAKIYKIAIDFLRKAHIISS